MLARILAERLSPVFGVTLVVENRPGAGGMVGTEYVAKQAADGYTILVTTITHVTNVSFFKKLPYEPIKDFEPISLVADCPVWFVAKAALPPKDLSELVAWMKENPGKATVGIGGVGGHSLHGAPDDSGR